LKSNDDTPGLASTKPYLIRALYEWCTDQGLTPYLSVAVDRSTQVPKAYVKEGQIVLNLSPDAVHQLVLGNEFITCSARFGGVAQPISVPIARVAAIYARENGNGMAFDIEDAPVKETQAEQPDLEGNLGDESNEPSTPDKPKRPKPGGRPHLTRVK
jgi:stringent starvation protein B